MNWALTWLASGDWLWAVLILGGIVLGILSVKAPAVYRMITAPFKKLWTSLKSGQIRTWLANTKVWLWLQSQQYDPPPRPLSWWVPRGLAIVVLFVLALWYAREVGRSERPALALGLISAPEKVQKIDTAWKGRALECEARLLQNRPEPVVPAVTITTVPIPVETKPVVDVKPDKVVKKIHVKQRQDKPWWEQPLFSK